MEGIIGLAILVVVGYFAIVILIAAIKGLGRTGRWIIDNFPDFFSKVFTSVFLGIVAGFIVGLMSGGNTKIASATGIGVAAAKALYDMFDA